MPSEIKANKRLVRQYFKAIEGGDLSTLDHIVADDYEDRVPGRDSGRQPLQDSVRALRAAFPDLRSTVIHIVAEGDLVAVYNRVVGTHLGPMGEMKATGNRVDFTAFQLFRVNGGILAEHWEIADEATLMRQLGA
ncbi:MAG TPA: ester cyclase [Solirubrobacteraceae bacterium]|jgi:predicted ester cyclase|nr:ester cyclase [Solirubrobacteraceae bacterium]